jgi:hypothetical protein
VLAIDDDLRAVVAEVRAGTRDAVLVVRDDALLARLGGTLRDARGAPVAGAEVELSATILDTGRNGVAQTAHGTRTDAGGRFALENVPWRNLELVASGDELERLAVPLDELDVTRALELVVRRRYRVLVEPARGERATHYAVLDEAGRELRVDFTLHDLDGHRERVPVLDQGQPVHALVPEGARTLVLFEGESELRRLPLVCARES